MATWEDGPEYAPTARPDAFSSADAAPLQAAPPVPQLAAGAPRQRPQFSVPPAPVAPLEALVPEPAEQRDPTRPFDVATSTLTSMDSAWGAAHWNAASHSAESPVAPVAGAPGPNGALPGPGPNGPGSTGPGPTAPGAAGPGATAPPWGGPAPWNGPTTPFPPVSGPAQLPAGYPPPGTPQWFGPGPGQPPQSPPPGRVDARAVLDAATPGLCICLAIGGLIYLIAPITLGIAFALSGRAKVAQEQIRQIFLVAWGFVGLLALARFMTDGIWLTGWWHFVGGSALVISWVVLVLVLALTYRDLKRGRPRPPASPYTSHWG